MIEPVIRVALRYGVGAVVSWEFGEMLAGDTDIVLAIAALVGLLTEAWWAYARKHGRAT